MCYLCPKFQNTCCITNWSLFPNTSAGTYFREVMIFPPTSSMLLEARYLRKAKICRCFDTHCCPAVSTHDTGVPKLLSQKLCRAHWGPYLSHQGNLGYLNAFRPFGLGPISAELWICLGVRYGPFQNCITYLKTEFCLPLWVQVRSSSKGLTIPETKLSYVAHCKHFFTSLFSLSC